MCFGVLQCVYVCLYEFESAVPIQFGCVAVGVAECVAVCVSVRCSVCMCVFMNSSLQCLSNVGVLQWVLQWVL